LYRRGSIKSHDKVMAVCIAGLVFRCGLGEAKDAPVGVAANNTAGAEDEGTGVAGDAEGGVSNSRCYKVMQI
jgi:hypothetical protein